MQPPIAYQIPGYYTQDQWFFRHNDEIYFYHLLAPLSAGDAGRWGKETIGVSRSKNLIDWDYLGIALGSSQGDRFDNRNLATGTTLEWQGKFYLFYCGYSSTPGNLGGIGAAVSSDLVHWQRFSDQPLVTPDARWYATNPQNDPGYSWADPFVFRHEPDRCFYMLITARTRGGRTEGKGCLAWAKSDDLIHWDQLPPFLETPLFDRLEVPQLWQYEGKWYLLICANGSIQSEVFRKNFSPVTESAAFVYTADDFKGPYTFRGRWWVLPNTGCYTARVITDTQGIAGFNGQHALMTWQSEWDKENGCIRTGATCPFPIQYLPEGGFSTETISAAGYGPTVCGPQARSDLRHLRDSPDGRGVFV